MPVKPARLRSDRKKEDLLEIAQLIKKATATTNSLLENSGNYNCKLRSEKKQMTLANHQNFDKSESKTSAKKQIKTVDVFKKVNKETTNVTEKTKEDQSSDRD